MNEPTTASPRNSTSKRSQKARALLAGGLIAGLGIVGTLATWNTSVVSQTRVIGSDTAPAIELTLLDANGNWVGGGTETAPTLLADVILSDKTTTGTHTTPDRNIGKVKTTGLKDDEKFLFDSKITAETTHLKGQIYLTSNECGYTGDFFADRVQLQGVANILMEFGNWERKLEFTGNLEKNICMSVVATDETPAFLGPDFSHSVAIRFDASPSPSE